MNICWNGYMLKKGHSGNQNLFKEAITRGWPVTRELRITVISACSQCHTQLRDDHPLKNPTLLLTQNKSLAVDYIGSFQIANRKPHILFGVEITSGLMLAEAVQQAMIKKYCKTSKAKVQLTAQTKVYPIRQRKPFHCWGGIGVGLRGRNSMALPHSILSTSKRYCGKHQ